MCLFSKSAIEKNVFVFTLVCSLNVWIEQQCFRICSFEYNIKHVTLLDLQNGSQHCTFLICLNWTGRIMPFNSLFKKRFLASVNITQLAFIPHFVLMVNVFIFGWKEFSIAYISSNSIPCHCRKSVYLKSFLNSVLIVKVIQALSQNHRERDSNLPDENG